MANLGYLCKNKSVKNHNSNLFESIRKIYEDDYLQFIRLKQMPYSINLAYMSVTVVVWVPHIMQAMGRSYFTGKKHK
uniref:Uncharacterized protein n=1 Tax=Anguilla anguilla TaxID=7936 RepID=A0A0E9Q677_ANGAN